MTDLGKKEALSGAQALKKNKYDHYDIAYTSALTRAQQTLEIILKEIDQTGLETVKDQALNERDYGDLTGLNKDDARAKFGEEQVRRAPFKTYICSSLFWNVLHRYTSGAARMM